MKNYLFKKTISEQTITKILNENKIQIVIGHPTYKNEDNIVDLIKKDIIGLNSNFDKTNAAIIISDGTFNSQSKDLSIYNQIKDNLEDLNLSEYVSLIYTPYENYRGNKIPGKGSALYLIFNEFYNAKDTEFLFLFDGDIRNDISQWLSAYIKVIKHFETNFRKQDKLFVTAKYARHFVDASLTRFVVSPLTTLMAKFVPGGISGDILLNKQAVALEISAEWNENRFKYGTDISTTFDNIYNGSIIYEVYLGAKLHDITDESKLSIMPGEVIGAALERLLYYQKQSNFLSFLLESEKPLGYPIIFDSVASNIPFIDPGYTDVFNIEYKIKSLIEKFSEFAPLLEKTISNDDFTRLTNKIKKLKDYSKNTTNEILFIDMNFDWYRELIYQIMGYLLKTEDIDISKKAFQYLYSGAFLEFCRNIFFKLGYKTYEDVIKNQNHLGVPKKQAKDFYNIEVDKKIADFAAKFYEEKYKIKKYME